MDLRRDLKSIQALYRQKVNIMKYLKQLEDRDDNSTEDILISYDFQAGSYTRGYYRKQALFQQIGARIAAAINELGTFSSFLEAGVGEATVLSTVLPHLNRWPERIQGFDLSWSRLKYGRKFLEESRIDGVQLFTGNLLCAPIKSNGADIVFTCHAVEPNGGREEEALRELYRMTNKYLVLCEPAYELADERAQNRMREHGYVTDLYQTALRLGYRVIEYRLLGLSVNPLNPTGLLIIEKNENGETDDALCCPITKSDLIRKGEALYSRESLLAYPILDQIPCLLPDNAIVASKFMDEW